MKKLYLVRHAKSEKDLDEVEDFDRPLNERGFRDANTMAEFLKEKNYFPEVFVTSPAVRALSTAVIFLKVMKGDWSTLVIRDSLYETPADTCIETIQRISDEYNSIMVFGHNPAMNEMYEKLTGNKIDNIPTTGVIMIDFVSDTWAGIMEQKGTVGLFEYPRHLEKA